MLWLWWRPEATVPIGPLAWEPPHAVGAALEKTKKKVETTGKSGMLYTYKLTKKKLKIEFDLGRCCSCKN